MYTLLSSTAQEIIYMRPPETFDFEWLLSSTPVLILVALRLHFDLSTSYPKLATADCVSSSTRYL